MFPRPARSPALLNRSFTFFTFFGFRVSWLKKKKTLDWILGIFLFLSLSLSILSARRSLVALRLLGQV